MVVSGGVPLMLEVTRIEATKVVPPGFVAS